MRPKKPSKSGSAGPAAAGSPPFVDLQRRIVKHRASILVAIEHGLSNGRIESVNTKIRLITRVAVGFRSPDALIALAMPQPRRPPTQSSPGRKDPRICQKNRICAAGFAPEL